MIKFKNKTDFYNRVLNRLTRLYSDEIVAEQIVANERYYLNCIYYNNSHSKFDLWATFEMFLALCEDHLYKVEDADYTTKVDERVICKLNTEKYKNKVLVNDNHDYRIPNGAQILAKYINDNHDYRGEN